jgi:amino acid transporter
MARAVKLTFFRILVFYVLSVLFLGMVVPYNSPELAFATKSGTRAAASPFVVAIKHAKIEGLDYVVNACLLIFVISAATSSVHCPIALHLKADDIRLLYCNKNCLQHRVGWESS